MGNNPGPIRVTGTPQSLTSLNSIGGTPQTPGLHVRPGQTLALMGGNLSLAGGQLTAESGQIQLGSAGPNSLVTLIPTAGFAPNYEGIERFQTIDLSQQAILNTSGQGGGTIQLQGAQILIQEGSQILSVTQGAQPGGNVTLRGTEAVAIIGTDPSNFTQVSSETQGAGAGGNLIVETQQFQLQGTAFLSTTSANTGPGGNILLRASDSALISGIGFDNLQLLMGASISGQIQVSDRIGGLFTSAFGDGAAGNVEIVAGSLNLQNGAVIFTPTVTQAPAGKINLQAANTIELAGSALLSSSGLGTQGRAGDIKVEARDLIVRDGGVISATTLGSGRGGDIVVKTSESVEVNTTIPGTLLPTGILNNTVFGTGRGGDIVIQTGRLVSRDGGLIVANSGGLIGTGAITTGGPGGNLTIEARESAEFQGVSADGRITSGPGTTTFTSSNAGDLIITTPRLTIADGAIVSSATFSSGNGGILTVNASKLLEIRGQSTLTGLPSTLVTSSGRADLPELIATGEAGNLNVRAGQLVVRDGATLDVRSLGSGNAGTLNIVADSIRLERGGSLSASTVAGAGGNIELQAQTIQLRGGSSITTNSSDTDGGNITMNTETLVALENSDISANAQVGRGGQVRINAQGILGTQYQLQLTPESDITATGGSPSLSGTVTINRPEVNPSAGLVELPETVTDASGLIGRNPCQDRGANTFTIVGKGGLPAGPDDPFNGFGTLSEWSRGTGQVDPTLEKLNQLPAPREKEPNQKTENLSGTLVEATNWTQNAEGQVMLTTKALNSEYSPGLPPLHCR